MSNGQVKKRAQLGTLEKEMSGANIIKNQTNNLPFSTFRTDWPKQVHNAGRQMQMGDYFKRRL